MRHKIVQLVERVSSARSVRVQNARLATELPTSRYYRLRLSHAFISSVTPRENFSTDSTNGSNKRQAQLKCTNNIREVEEKQELNASKELLKLSSGLIPLQMIKGALPFANSMILARLGSSTRASAVLINTLVDVNYLLFSSPTFCISAAVSTLNTPAEKKHIGEVVHAGWLLSGICSAPQMLIMYFNVGILTAAGQDPELVSITNEFLKIYLYAVPVVNLQNVSEQAIFSTGYPYLPCSVQVLSFVVWSVAAYGLSFGEMGLPELGIQGAAYAYLGRVYFNSAVFHSILFYKSKTDKTFAEYNIFKLQPGAFQRLKSMSNNALTIFGLFVLETGEIYLPNLFAGQIGVDALSAQLLVSQYQEFILFIVTGMAIASQVRVASALGNKKFSHIKTIGDTGVKLSLCLPFAYIGLTFISPELIIQAFVDVNDPANQAIIDLLIEKKVLLISGLNMFLIAFRMAAAEALIGAGKVGLPIVKNMATSWLGIGLGYAFGILAGYGIAGLNGGLMVGLFLSSIGQGRLWYKTSKALKEKALDEQAAESALVIASTLFKQHKNYQLIDSSRGDLPSTKKSALAAIPAAPLPEVAASSEFGVPSALDEEFVPGTAVEAKKPSR